MALLNTARPLVFCPGCSHEQITRTLDRALFNMGIKGNQVALVSDIGCSGLFDTFFNTHAMHGLHGRALTYATGLKLARPELTVIVTMGDGGQGIGGAHLLAACRRNLDLTLLILNNFNFGMTGGQFSATTPPDAQVGSGFLNRLEHPMDICRIAEAAGAPYVTRCSALRKDLAEEIERAVRFKGFSVIDLWGICPGRYTKRNRLTPKDIEASLSRLHPYSGPARENQREEYGDHYRKLAALQEPTPRPVAVNAQFDPSDTGRREVIILGSAGRRIVTAGEILCLAGMTAGLNVTQKNDYPITVLRGHSVSEIILSPQPIGYTGIGRPDVILALGREGVQRRKDIFQDLDRHTLIICDGDVDIPPSPARVERVDFKSMGIKSRDRALASLAILANRGKVIHKEMLKAALAVRFKGEVLGSALELVDRV